MNGLFFRVLCVAALVLTVSVSVAHAQSARPVRIMPLGASITHGSGEWGPNYRYYLWRDLVQLGNNVDFVGSQQAPYSGAYPFPDFDQDHEGHYGFRVDMLAANAEGWASAAQPDIVLVHAGTNDISQGQSVDSTLGDLAELVDDLRAANPAITVLMAQLIPCDPASGQGIGYCNPANMSLLNSQIPALAASLDTATSRVIAVDHAAGFDATMDLADGLHPNASGDQKIAARWLAALQPLLSAPPAPTPTPSPRWRTYFPLVAVAGERQGIQGPIQTNLASSMLTQRV